MTTTVRVINVKWHIHGANAVISRQSVQLDRHKQFPLCCRDVITPSVISDLLMTWDQWDLSGPHGWKIEVSIINWTPLDKMAVISQTTFSNTFLWMEMFEFRQNFTDVSSYGFSWQEMIIGSGNGLVPISGPMLTEFTDAYTRHRGRLIIMSLACCSRILCFESTIQLFVSIYKWRLLIRNWELGPFLDSKDLITYPRLD